MAAPSAADYRASQVSVLGVAEHSTCSTDGNLGERISGGTRKREAAKLQDAGIRRKRCLEK